MTTPAEPLWDSRWRLKNSLWMLPTVVCVGFFTWAAFLYIGVRARNKVWLGLAAGFFALAASTIVFSNRWSGGVLMLAWGGGIIAALSVRRGWLLWLADHEVNDTPWYGVPPAPTPGESAPASNANLEPAVRGGAPFPRDATPPPAAATGSVVDSNARIDLNRATRAELQAGLGVDDQWAGHIVEVRDQLGGFSDPDELMTKANLPPHVYARIRGKIAATSAQPPSTNPGASGGRRLEL